MLRTLILTSVLALVSCTADRRVEPVEDAEEEVSIRVSPLLGTFRGEPGRAGDLSLLVLEREHTYHAEKLVLCITTPCNPVKEDGTWRLTRRGLETLLVLTQGRETVLHRYRLRDDDWLVVQRLSPEGAWQTLQRAEDAWCDAPRDCEQQGLLPGPCAGHWRCRENTCSFACGGPVPDE